MITALASRYEITEHLGKGGFGKTFLAKDRHLPGCPLCVVKQLKPQQRDSQSLTMAKRLFEREAQILYRLGEHKQIPRLLAHFEQNEELYLVEDYIEGQTLEQELAQKKRLSEETTIELLQDILQVLTFVHQQNVIHRDIKPANLIRRNSDRKIVLIDFGAVKEVTHPSLKGNGHTNQTICIGSPGFIAPEQQLGNPHFSSDLYAVGMVALQAMTGLSPDKLPKNSQTGEYQWALVSGCIAISSGLAEILDKMVRQDYRQRYQDANEALKALEEMIARSVQETSCPRESRHNPCLDQPRGHVALGSSFYIERGELETRCYREIVKQAALIRLKAPLDMGKTSLMVRILDHAQKQGYRTILLPFTRFEETVYSDLNQLLRRFCALVSRELGISPKKINEYWDEEFFGPNDNCLQYFEECLLPEINSPLVLALDDLDILFYQHRVAKEFLKLVRYWHEQAKTNSIWSKVRLILAYSTEVYIVMDTNSSPFNVGMEIALPEFSAEQVLELAHRYGLSYNSEQVNRLMLLIGGHPYLIRVALYHLASHDLSLEELLQTAPTEGGLYGNHLRRHLGNLQEHSELLKAMQTVVTTDHPVRLEPELEFKLHRLGLVHFQDNEVAPRFELYRQYFSERLSDRP
ncbi:MAG: AAA-like domain-containing protein [Crocosphaera sp.]|nr:AAA-like domain-containing protein [Crocosphaera sp.]